MALDPGTKNSLFGNLKKDSVLEKNEKICDVITPLSSTVNDEKLSKKLDNEIDQKLEQPKWQTLDKVTVLLTTDQKSGLDKVAKKLMKYRSNTLRGNDEKERITANTLIRALIENFLSLESKMELETLSSEADVHRWIIKNLKTKSE